MTLVLIYRQFEGENRQNNSILRRGKIMGTYILTSMYENGFDSFTWGFWFWGAVISREVAAL